MNHAVKYVGLEELVVLVVWGHLMTEGGYYTITGEWI
jgi:1,4-dihydroxy-2-naphthoate octaprenyltransferase